MAVTDTIKPTKILGVTGTTSRQARRVAANRAGIEAAALRLFRERGYEAATIGDIAVEAGLSERTVYRHFNTKEEIVLSSALRELDTFMLALAARPADESPLDSLVAVAAMFAQGTPDLDNARLRGLLIRADPRLRGAYLDLFVRFEDQLALWIARRLKRPVSDLYVRLLAGCVATADRIISETWIDTNSDMGAFLALVEEAALHLRSGFTAEPPQ